MAVTANVLFREVQRFSPWVYVLCGGIAVFVLGGLGLAVFNSAQAPPLEHLVLPATLALLPFLLFAMLKVVTEVRDDGLYVRLFPLPFRRIAFADLRLAEVRTYRPLLEYGGWGWRYTLSHGWAYNARGNRGVQLELHSGKRILIGSQEPEDLLRAIREQAPVPA
jgi:hypothetical protein